MQTYGQMLRAAREQAGKSLRQVAEAIGVSVPYVSDVERGARRPLGPQYTMEVAVFLETDVAPLMAARERERGRVELETGLTDAHDRFAHLLSVYWTGLDADTLVRLYAALGSKE